MLVLSHRGYHKRLPENTLDAFDAALALGADGIETDIRLTADGQVVLFHDRLSPDGRPVADVGHDELNRLVGYEVPTASSALERWPSPLWNLEVKTPAALSATLKLIDQFGDSHRLLITSFWHPLIEAISAQKHVECGLLVCCRPSAVQALIVGDRPCRPTCIVWCFEFLDLDLIAQTRAAGLRNYAYGPQSAAEHQRARAWELDGLITDHLELCVSAASGSNHEC